MSDILMIGPIRFNSESYEVESHGKTAHLTPMEATTLSFLALHANQVCPFSQIALEAYGFDQCDSSSASALVSIILCHLRHKIEPDPQNPVYLLIADSVGPLLVLP